MSKPTEPGYYWLLDSTGQWEIVKVEADTFEAGGQLWARFCGWDEAGFLVVSYDSDRWGGKITQEPAPAPPPPF